MWRLKLLLDKKLIAIHLKFNDDFKNHNNL